MLPLNRNTIVLILLLIKMLVGYSFLRPSRRNGVNYHRTIASNWVSICLPCLARLQLSTFTQSSNIPPLIKNDAIEKTNFLTSLGSPKFICAPMVDQSYLPWRHMVRKHGVHLTFTQMINAKVFLRSSTFRHEVMDWLDYSHSNGQFFADEARDLDQPLIAQFAGDDPQTLISAAKIIIESRNICAIDLNLGCPQNIAKRGNYGAYLLPDTERVLHILSNMVNSLDCPVTAKIRKLPKDEDTIRLVQSMEKCGVQMITVHGRYVTQRKQYTGAVDWDIIKLVKQAVNIPIVANGGIGNLGDALNCLEWTGADAVMSSEGLLENPRLFSKQGDYDFHHDFVHSQLESARELVSYFQCFPQRKASTSSLRAHLFKMLHRFLASSQHHDIRSSFVNSSIDEMMELVNKLHNRFEVVQYQTKDAMEKGLLGKNQWYRRHYQVASEEST